MKYIIRLSGGWYYQSLGHGDWNRSGQDSATRFDKQESERIALLLRVFGAEVEPDGDSE